MEHEIRQPDQLLGYTIYWSRHASWVVYNELNNNRLAVLAGVEACLKDDNFALVPRLPVFTRFATNKGIGDLVFAADDPSDTKKNLLILAVQPPVNKVASVGEQMNCHWTTEIFPAENHSLIPITFEFARGSKPTKVINYAVDFDGKPSRINGEKAMAGFKHWISVAYSQRGIAVVDFLLLIRHVSNTKTQLVDLKYWDTKDEFIRGIQEEVKPVMEQIENDLYDDKGKYAPKEIRNLGHFFEKISSQMAKSAYANLDIYSEERSSNVNENLKSERFGKNVVPPKSRKKATGRSLKLGGVVALIAYALSAVLFIAGIRQGVLLLILASVSAAFGLYGYLLETGTGFLSKKVLATLIVAALGLFLTGLMALVV